MFEQSKLTSANISAPFLKVFSGSDSRLAKRDKAKNKRLHSKRGVGIMEVMVAALVLGILYAAVSNLQKGNRDVLLRIRGRDGATELAQNIIDSLGALGLANFSDAALGTDGDGKIKPLDTIRVTRSWEGQPGLLQNTMTVNYEAVVKVSPDSVYKATSTSQLLGEDSVLHVFAKRLDVTVSWPFKNSTQSITVSGVIR